MTLFANKFENLDKMDVFDQKVYYPGGGGYLTGHTAIDGVGRAIKYLVLRVTQVQVVSQLSFLDNL